MIGGDHQLYEEVLDLVEYWVPKEAYGHEREFQTELKKFLDYHLNEASGNDPLGIDMGGGSEIVVEKEQGSARADIAVDRIVGIELKRNLDNSRAKRELQGQIEEYLENYPFVIICTCGLEDTGQWRKLKNKYEGARGMGLGLEEGGEVAFVHKKKENYGKDPEELRGGGGFLGSGFFG